MHLSDLISHFEVAHYIKNRSIKASNVEISKLCYDSRDCEDGSLFFAVPGVHVDGHNYITKAIESGANSVVVEKDIDIFSQDYPEMNFIEVKNAKEALSLASAAFHDFPAEKLTLIGVTGTDGKSSTVSFISQLLKMLGIATGHISTVSMEAGQGMTSNSLRQSTPEAPEIHSLLAQMVSKDIEIAVIETTSHGLSPRTARLLHVPFDCAVLTNITHEHLEFHGSFEQYRDDKTNLFRALRSSKKGEPGLAVLNVSDPSSQYIQEQISSPIVFYGLSKEKAAMDLPEDQKLLYGDQIDSKPTHCTGLVHWQNRKIETTIHIPGIFNLENALASILAVSHISKKNPIDLVPLVSKLRGVKGRMLPLNHGQNFHVIVDYAHTPGSFERVFPIFRNNASARLIAVFGSAGERDIEKRPIQGAIAAKYSDVLVICDEDPRLEDSMLIINQIADGAMKENPSIEIVKISDRRKAIEHAFRIAEKDDTVVMLGKGHEQSIIYSQGKEAWDEETVARETLESMGFPQIRAEQE